MSEVVKMSASALCAVLLGFACVANKTVQAVQPTDFNLSCGGLKQELTSLGVAFEDAKADSGVTGENVGMAVVFWPGIFVNESRANRNQDSIQRRIDHLTELYVQKCSEQNEDS